MAEQAAKAPVAVPVRTVSIVDWLSGLVRETVETLQDARAALEMDARVSARSRATVRRIDALLERLDGGGR